MLEADVSHQLKNMRPASGSFQNTAHSNELQHDMDEGALETKFTISTAR